jgi:type 1 glutamine amidotransferase
MFIVEAAAALLAAVVAAPEPIPTLLITGHNNHNWQYTSRVHADTLEATGRFAVTITDDPARTLADAAALAPYRLFVLDYNDIHDPRRWGEAAERNFVAAVEGGVGVVAIHAANNAFRGWADYERMLGLMWRDGTGHGRVHEFGVEWVDRDHPITRGMAEFTTRDELYHDLVNSQNARYSLLARAMSSSESGGSGKHEPMAFTLAFGRGRVFATPLGHVWVNAEDTKSSITTPGFRTLLVRGAEWAATGAVTLPAEWRDVRAHNTLTPQEKAAGWRLLFDGRTTSGWRGYRKASLPENSGWTVRDGELAYAPGKAGGDIVTDEQFGDFELALEFKVAPGGNSGIIYRATEDHDYPWQTGPEFQILDDLRHGDKAKPTTRTGSFYDVFGCAFDTGRPAGEWNQARIVCRGGRIEHWLNGFKVVDLDLGSDEYKAAHARSKWTGMPAFATRAAGHVALQDHGDRVWFRNIKVRTLE